MSGLKPSMFVAIEGLNGSGKSTLVNSLVEMTGGFESHLFPGFDVIHTTREIGGSWMAEKIRDIFTQPDDPVPDSYTELLLINAARREHLRNKICKWLASPGNLVLCDRYIASTYAYQYSFKEFDDKPDLIFDMHADFCGGIYPDLTIHLSISPETSMKRTQKRRSWSIPDTLENHKMLSKIENGYHAYGNMVMDLERSGIIDHGRWYKMNANLGSDIVAQRVRMLIMEHSEKPRNSHEPIEEWYEFQESKGLPS